MSEVAKKKEKEDLSKYFGTNDRAAKELVILLHGHQDAGKTFTAASASAFFPEKLGTRATLKDMLWIPGDPGATAGLRRYGIEIPEISLLGLLKDLGTIKAIDTVVRLAESAKDSRPELENVVIDTLTAVSKYIGAHFDTILDGPQMHGRINATLTRLHCGLVGSGLTPIYLAHSKHTDPMMAETTSQKNAKAAAGTEDNPIVPEIPGAAFKLFVGASRLIGVCDRSEEKGRPDKYKLYFKKSGWLTKNTFRDGLVNDVEEAHLGPILAKIRASMREAGGA